MGGRKAIDSCAVLRPFQQGQKGVLEPSTHQRRPCLPGMGLLGTPAMHSHCLGVMVLLIIHRQLGLEGNYASSNRGDLKGILHCLQPIIICII